MAPKTMRFIVGDVEVTAFTVTKPATTTTKASKASKLQVCFFKNLLASLKPSKP